MELILAFAGIFSMCAFAGISVWIWERLEYRKIEKYQAEQYRKFKKYYGDKYREYIKSVMGHSE